jgi:hypothetical protein
MVPEQDTRYPFLPFYKQAGMLFLIIEEYFAFVRAYQSHDHVERGCFPGSVRAKQSDYLSLLHLNRYMVDNRTVLVFLYEVIWCGVSYRLTLIGFHLSGCTRDRAISASRFYPAALDSARYEIPIS